MRLLNSTTLELKEFIGKVPPYAILSHCWEEEEVLFADMSSLETARLKKGFSKVQSACEKAPNDGHKYIWIDSCAIDKSSSAELSEAINSMFAWYRDAEVCYIYLADVRGAEDMRKSKWFTRAWTLQELIAPCCRVGGFSKLRFLSGNWLLLNGGATSVQFVSYYTGIPREHLHGRSLEAASISMRMSWAAGRVATRAEDIAYALLGVFNVNMPLLYGEGKVKAFHRLQEEIMKVSEDETLFAWSCADLRFRNSGALAADPTSFIMTKYMVPFRTEAHAVPPTMTPRGLRIRMQLLNLPMDVENQL
ncbi:hypothetical protein NX059_006513 [Plenodomus lindquistii]|nr:hypothetical protein NX059_006513 [Plenodomus lindquistii]